MWGRWRIWTFQSALKMTLLFNVLITLWFEKKMWFSCFTKRRLSCAFHCTLLQSTGIILFVQSLPSCCPSKPHKLGFTAVLAVPDFGVRIFLSVVLVILSQISGEYCDNPLKSNFCENHKVILLFYFIFCFVCRVLLAFLFVCFVFCCALLSVVGNI